MGARTRYVVGFAAIGALATSGHAQIFSVAPGGPSGLGANLLYTTNSAGVPVPVGGGNGMRLPSPQDDIDAISRNRSLLLDLHFEWIWWFSVDAGSVGLPPEVLPGYNVENQAIARQQAGDIFMSTEGFDANLGLLPAPPSLGLNNNALVINQSAQYPRFAGLLPAANPFVTVPSGTDQDELNATDREGPPAPGAPLFFSLSASSPSLPNIIPGIVPSGANIFVDFNIQAPGTENLYAIADVLGLVPADDISSLVVFDENQNSIYDTPDAVYFTLARGSPSLLLFGGSAASILVSRGGTVSLFVENFFLGLAPGDQLDGLDVVPIMGDSVLETIEFEFGGPSPCPADFTGHAVPSVVGFGTPDGVLNNEDFFAYLILFSSGNTRADLTAGAVPGQTGYGVPNGIINNEDFFYYLQLFAAGC